jgi:hypothetical protein
MFKLCYYCGEPCNDLAGNPGLWTVYLCHKDDRGVPKAHHIQCISERLDAYDKILQDRLQDLPE